MGEDGEPALRDCVAIVAMTIVDAGDGRQILSHHPGWVQVGRGWDEVADIGGLLILAFKDDGLVMLGVSGK